MLRNHFVSLHNLTCFPTGCSQKLNKKNFQRFFFLFHLPINDYNNASGKPRKRFNAFRVEKFSQNIMWLIEIWLLRRALRQKKKKKQNQTKCLSLTVKIAKRDNWENLKLIERSTALKVKSRYANDTKKKKITGGKKVKNEMLNTVQGERRALFEVW